uniref:Uncharacterized protein n=1 Tax=Peromyscus maniculatus bairdii TaxID=230844 RepID=A0A8C8UNW9_PERMB
MELHILEHRVWLLSLVHLGLWLCTHWLIKLPLEWSLLKQCNFSGLELTLKVSKKIMDTVTITPPGLWQH